MQVEGDEEFLREMLAEFANEAQGHVDSLQTAVAEGNAEVSLVPLRI
jgi:hypothetical protein